MQRSEIWENPGFRPIGLHPGYKSFYTASKSQNAQVPLAVCRICYYTLVALLPLWKIR